jgi:hypothetical protein
MATRPAAATRLVIWKIKYSARKPATRLPLVRRLARLTYSLIMK